MNKTCKLVASCFLMLLPFYGIAQFKVIGYLPTWMNFPNSINSVQLTKVTHINIAFANPNGSGVLIPSDGVSNANVTTVVNTAHAAGVKVFMSMGGAGASKSTYHNLIVSNQATFVTNIVNYATTYNLDGIDVDIEGDILDGSGTGLTASQYQGFVTALGTALRAQSKLMSSALAGWFANYVTNTAAAQFDWINIMSYDDYGPWSGPGQHSPYSLAVSDFQYWNTTKAVPASKLVIGVPFYGYGWGTYASSDEISYCTIVSTYAGAENNDQVGSGSNVIYYNGIPTIQQKTTYALAHAAGIMIWEIAEDCNNSKSLVSAIYNVVHPLPVELIDFSGTNRDYKNELAWSTAVEVNDDYYDIQRSADGSTFVSLGTVDGNGNSREKINYSFSDLNPLDGSNYYRLAQYDVDGTVKYSPLIIVNNNFNIQYQVSPNPFEQEIKVVSNTDHDLLIQVINAQGLLVYGKSFSGSERSIALGSDLASGVYFIKIMDGSSISVQKIIKR